MPKIFHCYNIEKMEVNKRIIVILETLMKLLRNLPYNLKSKIHKELQWLQNH